MKCYYEVLNVGNNCESDEIKKSYRKLALIVHPDKNLENTEDAKLQFQIIQEAYEVLMDPEERAWYDQNREILLAKASGELKDRMYDVYPYFRTSCYKGFEEGDQGFYNVYRKVFNTIAAEELNLEEVPTFGDSESSFEDVLKFYSFWNCFCTKEEFYWLTVYDIRKATNKKIFKRIEKGNKKIRDGAKKERNELIRNLVRYVGKRDQRLIAYSKMLKKKAKENSTKAEKHRKNMLEKHREMVASCNEESEWSKFSNLEEKLYEIELNTMKEFNENDSSEHNDDKFFCTACNKYFKNVNSFENHENSKKHRENFSILKQQTGEGKMENIKEDENLDEKNEGENAERKKKIKKNKRKENLTPVDESSLDFGISKKQRKKLQRIEIENNKENEEMKIKKKKDKKKSNLADGSIIDTRRSRRVSAICKKCNEKFFCKTTLLDHLQNSGHSVYLFSKYYINVFKIISKPKKLLY